MAGQAVDGSELFSTAKTAAAGLWNALANPASDTLAAADTAVVSFLRAVEGHDVTLFPF